MKEHFLSSNQFTAIMNPISTKVSFPTKKTMEIYRRTTLSVQKKDVAIEHLD